MKLYYGDRLPWFSTQADDRLTLCVKPKGRWGAWYILWRHKVTYPLLLKIYNNRWYGNSVKNKYWFLRLGRLEFQARRQETV